MILGKNEILEILNFMNALYPNRKIMRDVSTVSSWMMMLDGYEKDEVIQAIKNLSSRIRYIPNIPEILDEVKNVFRLENKKIGDVMVIRVIFHDESFTFKFVQKSSIDEFIGFMKTNPSIEDIRMLNITNVLEMAPHAVVSSRTMESLIRRHMK